MNNVKNDIWKARALVGHNFTSQVDHIVESQVVRDVEMVVISRCTVLVGYPVLGELDKRREVNNG